MIEEMTELKNGVPSREDAGPKEIARWLQSNLPYRREPYSKRSWGHKLHSLCSYQGKLKPAIAHWLIRLFSRPDDRVLDPLGGVGTVAFEACCQGREAITNDLSPLPYTVAWGKVRPPVAARALDALRSLEDVIMSSEPHEEDIEAAKFGLNGAVEDFYHPKTLREVLIARRYFRDLESPSDADAFVKASLLHVLHGNRPYALSRRSHSITPFHPSGPAEYRSLIRKVRDRITRALSAELPDDFRKGNSLNKDFRELPDSMEGPVDVVITSPPFLGMRFDRPNWLRLWFCGWREEDFHHTSKAFLERQQKQSLAVYEDFFEFSTRILRPGGVLVLHLGGSTKHTMVEKLHEMGQSTMKHVKTVNEDVSAVESHGISDKGLTTSHHFLIFERR